MSNNCYLGKPYVLDFNVCMYRGVSEVVNNCTIHLMIEVCSGPLRKHTQNIT